MKAEGLLFAIGTVFFGIVAIAYWILSHDPVGVVALALTGGLCFLISFFMLYAGRRVGYRPEDRSDAEISDADPDYGFFSPHSWWPLPVGVGSALIAIGFVFAVWVVVLGLGVLFVSLVGFVYEYYRGAWAE